MRSGKLPNAVASCLNFGENPKNFTKLIHHQQQSGTPLLGAWDYIRLVNEGALRVRTPNPEVLWSQRRDCFFATREMGFAALRTIFPASLRDGGAVEPATC